MTPILYSSAILLVSASISAVFPEPTGPATPTFTYDILISSFLFTNIREGENVDKVVEWIRKNVLLEGM